MDAAHALKILVLPAVVAAGFAAGCEDYHSRDRNDVSMRDRDRASYGTSDSRNQYRTDDRRTDDRSRAGWPEARILSILHAANQEEIAVGNLAASQGDSRAVRSYGEMLVEHHRMMDDQLQSVASRVGVSLMSSDEVKRMKMQEMNKPAAPDVVSELSRQRGAAFDREFAQRMIMDHSEVISLVEQARRQPLHPEVVSLIDQALPRLRQHEQEARDLLK
ncbi:MAG: DUF4142 domain-containing protein [Phycisphaerales bacterium]|nr:DUF4142 domain-containing protein [Phycisphaerales bacterium]